MKSENTKVKRFTRSDAQVVRVLQRAISLQDAYLMLGYSTCKGNNRSSGKVFKRFYKLAVEYGIKHILARRGKVGKKV